MYVRSFDVISGARRALPAVVVVVGFVSRPEVSEPPAGRTCWCYVVVPDSSSAVPVRTGPESRRSPGPAAAGAPSPSSWQAEAARQWPNRSNPQPMGSKSKKRVVLASRPEPPTVDQILEDISRAANDDPVFSILDDSAAEAAAPPADSAVEVLVAQCRRHLQVNQQLQEAGGQLRVQTEQLQAVGEKLHRDLEKVRSQSGGMEGVASSLPSD